MRSDPERFVTFVLGSFALVYYLVVGYQFFRVQRRIGRSPIANRTTGLLSLIFPLPMLTWAYNPRWFLFLPNLCALERLPVRLLGLLLLCAAAALLWTAYLELGGSWRVGVDPQSASLLVQTGIYASIRHPIYTALWLWSLGTFLLAPNLLFAMLWAGASSIVVWLAHQEETFLRMKYGKTYENYLIHTGRFFPLFF